MGARIEAKCFRMKAGILSGPVALVVSSVSSNFCIPLVVMLRGGWVGMGCLVCLVSDHFLV